MVMLHDAQEPDRIFIMPGVLFGGHLWHATATALHPHRNVVIVAEI